MQRTWARHARDDIEDVVGSSATLGRADGSITATICSLDLPAGLYTFWWHLTHEDAATVLPEGEERHR